MTLEEWTDIVARMTPEQREAMGYAMMATRGAEWLGEPLGIAVLKDALDFSPLCARDLVLFLYPG